MNNIFADTSFNGIKNSYYKIENKYKNASNNNSKGGFLDKSQEKVFKYTIDYWRKITAKGDNPNVNKINQLVKTTKGDPNKLSKEILDTINFDYKMINNIFKCTKNKNITDYSVLKIYKDTIDTLFEKKNVDVFKKAYELKEKSDKTSNSYVLFEIILILYIILLFVAIFDSVAVNTSIFGDLGINRMTKDSDFKQGGFINSNIDRILESSLSNIQKEYKGNISGIGYASIEISEFLKASKNPSKDLDEAVKRENDIKKKLNGSENLDLLKRQKLYNEISEESFIVDKSLEPSRGKEDFVSATLIIVGVIAGVIVLINVIRRAIYQIGTTYIDFIGMIVVENECLRMNVAELERKKEAETDPKAIKKLESIIEKQKKWNTKFDSFITNAKGESTDSSYKADEEISSEDNQTESKDDDFEIIL